MSNVRKFLLAVGVTTLMAFLSGCSAGGAPQLVGGGNTPVPHSPEQTAEAWLQAMAAGDMKTVEAMVDQSSGPLPTETWDSYEILEPPADLAAIGFDSPIADIEIGESRESEDGGATVPTSFTVGGKTYDLDVTLRQGDEGVFLVTNGIPVLYVMDIGTKLENKPNSWLANGTDIGLQPVYRVPYGEFMFEPADSGRYDEVAPISEGTRVIVGMVPGFENMRDVENAQELIDQGYPERIEH